MQFFGKYKISAHALAVGFVTVAGWLATHESYFAGHPKAEAVVNVITALSAAVALYANLKKS